MTAEHQHEIDPETRNQHSFTRCKNGHSPMENHRCRHCGRWYCEACERTKRIKARLEAKP